MLHRRRFETILSSGVRETIAPRRKSVRPDRRLQFEAAPHLHLSGFVLSACHRQQRTSRSRRRQLALLHLFFDASTRPGIRECGAPRRPVRASILGRGHELTHEKPPDGDHRAGRLSGQVGAPNRDHAIPFLVAVALDDHLAIRFPVALPDDRCFARLALAFPNYGRSFAISVAVIRTYRHSGSDRANSDTNADLSRARRYCGAYACRCNYCQYVLHESLLALCAPMGSIRRVSFRSDRIDHWTALRLRAFESAAISEKRAKRDGVLPVLIALVSGRKSAPSVSTACKHTARAAQEPLTFFEPTAARLA